MLRCKASFSWLIEALLNARDVPFGHPVLGIGPALRESHPKMRVCIGRHGSCAGVLLGGSL